MDAANLTHATREAYLDLHSRLRASRTMHIVRLWNFIPALLEATGPDMNRYMAFNAGRYAAMREWYGDALAAHAPAGTGVGSPGDDLVIHALGCPTPGTAVQNPRQTPPVDYSPRYGPRPPCFARATRVGRCLLVSGTAAITGEDTVAPDDLARQLTLTLDHLLALVGSLAAYRTLRAYVPRAADLLEVKETLEAHFSPGIVVQFVVTDLCRPELRVEIEGVADDSTRP